ncbi:Abi family protein [Halothiobacillus sp.]|uniref:Abi family protein n=1 Tax=Halothiobacillus sp. TaxID=1891311 RepID=UPI002635F8BB|nr:Abi family protein [Halothiobacillus sp.]
MKSFKPWLSFADQLQRLRDRGLVVENKAAALDYLERIGYYRLSGYRYPLRGMDKAASNTLEKPVRADTFEPGSRFEDVVRLYVFDKKLRLLALDALERIEMAIRVDVAHLSMDGVGVVAAEMKTDAYTKCRGAGHIEVTLVPSDTAVKPNFDCITTHCCGHGIVEIIRGFLGRAFKTHHPATFTGSKISRYSFKSPGGESAKWFDPSIVLISPGHTLHSQ